MVRVRARVRVRVRVVMVRGRGKGRGRVSAGAVLDREVVVEVGLVQEDDARLEPLQSAGARGRELGHERRRRVQPAALEADLVRVRVRVTVTVKLKGLG